MPQPSPIVRVDETFQWDAVNVGQSGEQCCSTIGFAAFSACDGSDAAAGLLCGGFDGQSRGDPRVTDCFAVRSIHGPHNDMSSLTCQVRGMSKMPWRFSAPVRDAAGRMDFTEFAVRLKAARARAGTQEDVAALMRREGGANLRTLARWEHGEVAPRADHLQVFCLVTGSSADWLLGLPGGEPPGDATTGVAEGVVASGRAFVQRARTNLQRESEARVTGRKEK